MSTASFTPLQFIIITIHIFVFPFGRCCMVEYCAGMYSQKLDEGGIIIGKNAPYCQVITDYIFCLQGTSRSCRGNLKFHTLQTLLQRQKREFSCSAFPETASPSEALQRRCNFLADSMPHAMHRYCTAFGSRHVRRFDGHFETCARSGAYPLIDNRYLLVQITHSNLANRVNALTKVTVIVKATRHCTSQKQYEAGTEDAELAVSFVDGTMFSGDRSQRTVEIRPHNGSHVEIALQHIATMVYVRRQGPFLSVAIRIPETLLKEQLDDGEQLCTTGCVRGETVRIKEALANPHSFTRCQGIHLKTPLKIATDRCARVGVNDAFFDACVFDLLMSGDEMLVALAADAEHHIEKFYPPYSRHYANGRHNLSIYDSLSAYEWKHCPAHSISSSSSSPFSSFFLNVDACRLSRAEVIPILTLYFVFRLLR
uniref:RGM domain family member B n=1 Tax=Ascaris suum TaxID=6253 RepID=F1L5K8_ASCSU